MSGQADSPASSHWNPTDYARHGRFVADLALPVVDLLAPRPGERILDLGCGDGALTEKLTATGAVVVGVDSSPEFVAAAQARGLDARQMDGHALTFSQEFHAVFSNAALHWMLQPAAVIAGVARALKPGGRFVGELGGHTNVAAILVAALAVLRQHGIEAQSPWYFPTAVEYRHELEAQGLEVDEIQLIPRPTPLPAGGMSAWLTTFAHPLLLHLPPDQRASIESEIVDLLRPALCDASGNWTADYVRLRFRAHLP